MVIIGEKINATDPAMKAVIQEREADKLWEMAQMQADAGAGYIDVNVGTGVGSLEDEIASMVWAVETIQQKVETPLCIDSADALVLEAGLEARDGKYTLINSTKADEKSLGEILPLAVHYQTPLVALAMDDHGIPKTTRDRLNACRKIASMCLRLGLTLENVYFDPLVLPVSTDIKQGLVSLDTLSAIKKEFPMAKTVIGLSNVSYGLPGRAKLNAAFLHMAALAGLDVVIMDPFVKELMGAVKTAEVLVGKDRHCRRYTRHFRNKKSD